MKLPFVTRKKYEIEKQNCKLLNDERVSLSRKNKELQLEIKKLKADLGLMEEEVSALKIKKTRNTTKKTKKEVK